MSFSHKSVLLTETVEYLTANSNKGVFVDATLGFGGHSKEIIKRVSTEAILVGIDCDSEALEIAGGALAEYGNFKSIKDNYSNIDQALARLDIKSVAGVVYDLGVSSLQFDKKERGFSFQAEAELDMRMDTDLELTAYDVVNVYNRADLERVILDYGEEYENKKIADFILRGRPIKTTFELADIVKSAKRGKGKIHPATKVFQAIRIEVNDELHGLQTSLEKAVDLLETGGRICVISFHSLEDRIVKRFFLKESKGCNCGNVPCTCGLKKRLKIITKKPIVAGIEEVNANPRSRSAKLRVAEKIS